MHDSRWRFWIDVGGTFTDCLAMSPDGLEHSLKILSSGVIKGAGVATNESCIVDETLIGGADQFWQGCQIRLATATDQRANASSIASFCRATGRIELSRPLPILKQDRIDFQIDPQLTAPALAIHLLTKTPISGRLPACDVQLGTTKGTNALLTRTGARTVLVTSTGFRDFLTIGNQTRPNLFALTVRKPEPLFEKSIEIGERILSDGTVETEPDVARIRQQLQSLKQDGVESIAICLMHAWRFPQHERMVADVARELGFADVRASSEVAPLIKIVARGETTVLDAYLNPVIDRYLNRIVDSIGLQSDLRLMTSGGHLTTRTRFSGKDSVLSGPAGGVVGAARIAQQAGFSRMIGFDMGGTSTDVCRFEGEFEIEYETHRAGVNILTPMMAIETVAAGGGSICRFDGTRITVGPESAGADPGPACYGCGGPLTVTDVNLFLGRLDERHFPFRLDPAVVATRLAEIREAMRSADFDRTLIEIADGFLQIANHNMANAIRNVSVTKGFDPRDHVLVSFGGAGGQHCCSVAEILDIKQILVHPRASFLSAYGIQLGEHSHAKTLAVMQSLTPVQIERVRRWANKTGSELSSALIAEGCPGPTIASSLILELRYCGTDLCIPVREPEDGDFETEFVRIHTRLFGYEQTRDLEIVTARVVATSRGPSLPATARFQLQRTVTSTEVQQLCSKGKQYGTGRFDWQQLVPGDRIHGPAAISDSSTTTIVDLDWQADVLEQQQLLLSRTTNSAIPVSAGDLAVDPVDLEIFNGSFRSIALQMGASLQKTSVSVNVKERLDFSCALFSREGDLVVNAPHIPVHLGAMAETVRATMALNPEIFPGDVFVTNDPYAGGSHLPDVTVLTPVFCDPAATPCLWVASRSHHAEIGGIAPGSMPAGATRLSEEGVLIQNFKLMDRGVERFAALESLLAGARYPSRNPAENMADIAAQVAANRAGINGLEALIERHSFDKVAAYMGHVRMAAAQKTRMALSLLPDGEFELSDCMDDGSRIQVSIRKQRDSVHIDFGGTAPVHAGNLNANRAIVTSALIYVLRCLIAEDIPLNEGVLEPVSLVLPECFLNPRAGATPDDSPAVVGGNVETSQRIVDVMLGALRLAAASQGTMNNWLVGDPTFGYYETVGGGSGATASGNGADAVHCHMSNTRLTDPEVLETRYPMVLRKFGLRPGSGGHGKNRGGVGMIREIEFRAPLTLSILSSRRSTEPFGLLGGESGSPGENRLIKPGGGEEILPSQCERQVQIGERLRISTPGGGGFGKP